MQRRGGAARRRRKLGDGELDQGMQLIKANAEHEKAALCTGQGGTNDNRTSCMATMHMPTMIIFSRVSRFISHGRIS